MRPIRTLLLALAAGLAAGPVAAATVKADYGIWLGGLPLGSADLATTVEGQRYKMQLQVRLTGLAGLLTGGKGAATSTGAVAGPSPVPSSFAITSQSSNAQRTVRIGLASGTVAAVDIDPPLEDRGDRVPVREAHKRGVVDPVSGLLMPAVARGELTDPANCNRTIPVFDGGARFDIVLRYSETKSVDKPGYKGPVIVCSARYVAIAGHRADRPAAKFMEDNRDMWVWLAPVEGARLLLPMRIEVKTTSGMSLIEASRWSAEGEAKVVPATTGATDAPPVVD
ncbi:MAG TPA: DUF3108 domain-containing protein [Microvirga sp.]|nr:DUF3108 domain-containing protein [Microvirga sp.]